MLRILREYATSWMLRGLLILVAVTFISWGGYSLVRERKVTYAAKVNKTVIEMIDYNEAYQNMIKQYRDALGPSFSEKTITEFRLKEKVLDNLISRVLILQEAKRLGLTVSDEELRETIESTPYFHVNGQFDPRLYERALRANRMSPEDYEQMQRENLLFSKVVNQIRLNGGKVSEDEVWDIYSFENEQINLNFLKVSPDAFMGQVHANDAEVKDYFQKHQDEFKTPTLIQVQYLIFQPSDFEGKSQISADEIKRYYDLKKERFKTAKRVRAREILIKVGSDELSNKIEEKKKRAEEILEKAKKTKDFASLAKQYSESNSASKGGDMGWVQSGMVDEAIQNSLSSMKAGEVSSVVRGRDGFHILKAEEAEEEKYKSLEEVNDQILQTLKKEKVKNEVSRRADEAFYALFRSRDLEGFSKEKDIPIKTTGFFKEGDEIPEVGRNSSFHSSAFSLKVGEISPVVNVPPNFYILKLVDKKESRIPPLKEVREEVNRKLIGIKSEEKARQVAEDLLGEIQKGKAMNEVAKERGLQMEETGFSTRTGGIVPKIGPAGEFMGALSSLTEENRFAKEVLQTKEGYFVVQLLASKPADREKFLTVKNNLEKRLIYQKQEEFFQNWLNGLRAKAKIETNQELIKL
jgi:peptidyl-prolyl cis-trans isomerase D